MNTTPALATMQNLGRKSAEVLARVGVHTPEQLRQADAIELYIRLRAAWPATSLNMLYALIGAQEGRHWRDVQRERRTELLLKLDEVGHAPR